MSVQDPTTLHHHDNLQQAEDIPSGIIVWVLVASTVVSVICIFIAWVFLVYCFGEVRPNMSLQDYPERNLGVTASIPDLAIEQEYFSLPVQPGESIRTEQTQALQGFGKSSVDTGATVDANAVHIPISEAKKLFIQQQAKGAK
jgi:hypothetical protein